MNINAINELTLKKANFKLGESTSQPAPETPVAKPEAVMNALHLQGMNNISFQGGKSVELVKKIGQRVAVAAPLLVGALVTGTTTSCDPDIWNPQPIVYPLETPNQRDTVVVNVEVNNEVNVNIDMAAMNAWLEKLYNQNAITAADQAAFQAQLLEIIQQYGDDAKAYQSAMLDFAAQIALYSSITAGNTTEIIARLEDIKDLYKLGLIKFDEALEIMKNIDNGMGVLSSWLKELYDLEKINHTDHMDWHNEMMDLAKFYGTNTQEYQIAMLDLAKQIALSTATSAENTAEILARYDEIIPLLEDGLISLDEAIKLLAGIDDKLDTIIDKLDDMIEQNATHHYEMTKEQNKANEILDRIANNQIGLKDFADFKAIIQNISDNVDVIKGNTYDLIELAKDPTRHNELIEAIKNAQSNPVDLEKFEKLFEFYGIAIGDAIKMSGEELAAKLDLFMEKYAANEALNQKKLDEIAELVGKLLDKVGGLSNDLNTYYNIFDGYWTDALAYLENLTKDVSTMKGDISGLKSLQKDANTMLEKLLAKAGDFEKLLADSDGMTVEEFEAALQERDQKQYEKWVKFAIDMGLDNLPKDVATIKDLVAGIKAKLDAQKDYSDQLDRIIDKLDGLDLTAEENQEILKAIKTAIENHKCDCNCTNGSHEGILGDVEKALGGLV